MQIKNQTSQPYFTDYKITTKKAISEAVNIKNNSSSAYVVDISDRGLEVMRAFKDDYFPSYNIDALQYTQNLEIVKKQ